MRGRKMKIPVYNRQISYQATPAQNVEVAAPLYQAVQGKQSKLMQAIQTAQNGIDFAQHMQELLEGENGKKQAKNMSFADPARKELLQFCREKLFSDFDPKTQNFSAVEKLDAYVADRFAHKEQDELWVEDYALIRREIENLQSQYQEQQYAAQYQQAEQTFVEYAALAPTAKVLQEYIEQNLAQMHSSYPLGGASQTHGNTRQSLLSVQAVEHNILAALQSRDYQQAQEVFEFFGDKLSPHQRKLLGQKITHCRSMHRAEELISAVQEPVFSPDGQIRVEKLEELAGHESKNKEEKEMLSRALLKRAGQLKRQSFLNQAQVYEKILFGLDSAAEIMDQADIYFQNQELLTQFILALIKKDWN